MNNSAYLNLGVVIAIGVVLLFFIILFFVARWRWKKWLDENVFHDHAIFLVRLPKDTDNEEDKSDDIHEEISKAEIIFASIGGLKAQKDLKSKFMGRTDHFSFELVAHNGKIAYYVAAPKRSLRYLEQQIHAYYPDAVLEEIEDYNMFTPQCEIIAGYIKTKKNLALPIKSYDEFSVDPMNSIINVLSKIEKDEAIAIQYVVRSAMPWWHRHSKNISREMTKGKSFSESMRSSGSILARALKTVTTQAKPQDPTQEQKKLSQVEEEMLKKIEEKNSRAGLDVNLRIVVCARNKGQAQLYFDNIGASYNQYDLYEYGNGFNSVVKGSPEKVVTDFIYRRFRDSTKFLLNTEELSSVYHFPIKSNETPNILWLTARHSAAPGNTPKEGIILGENTYRGVKTEIKILREDRRRHTYIVGKSGVGKSVCMTNMAVQDIMNGDGLCVLDPHGDLVEDILERVPPERAEDVILFKPSDTERPLGLNLLEYDEKYPEQKTFVINEMIKIFDKLYDLKSSGGPMFEQYARNAMLLIMDDPESGSTLMEISKVLADEDFRKMKLEKCKNQTVVDFWRKEAEKAGGEAALANIVPYVTSKLTQFTSNDVMRPIIAQQNSAINFRDVMDNQKILLIDLSKGKIGEMNAYLLGLVLIGKILMAALSRTDISKEKRNDFYLYIDEFQNFTTDSISAILSEARKYGLSLIIAHQYIGQLEEKGGGSPIKDAVFGNVGTWISFKVGSEDAEPLEKEFGPVFNQYDLINVEKGGAYVKLLIDNTASEPFSMKTIWPLLGTPRAEVAARARALSRMKYGQDRNVVEAEILKRAKKAEESEKKSLNF